MGAIAKHEWDEHDEKERREGYEEAQHAQHAQQAQYAQQHGQQHSNSSSGIVGATVGGVVGLGAGGLLASRGQQDVRKQSMFREGMNVILIPNYRRCMLHNHPPPLSTSNRISKKCMSKATTLRL